MGCLTHWRQDKKHCPRAEGSKAQRPGLQPWYVFAPVLRPERSLANVANRERLRPTFQAGDCGCISPALKGWALCGWAFSPIRVELNLTPMGFQPIRVNLRAAKPNR